MGKDVLLHCVGNHIVVGIVDNGPGMPDSFIERTFSLQPLGGRSAGAEKVPAARRAGRAEKVPAARRAGRAEKVPAARRAAVSATALRRTGKGPKGAALCNPRPAPSSLFPHLSLRPDGPVAIRSCSAPPLAASMRLALALTLRSALRMALPPSSTRHFFLF